MSEVPHCPNCKRADKVKVRSGNGYEYFCRKCHDVILPDDIIDGPFIDMTKDSMYRKPEEVKKKAEFYFSDECECNWCQKGRPGLKESKESIQKEIESNR